MAEGVVVDLELVNVEHTQGEGDLEAHSLLPLAGADAVVPPPVGHAGELVSHGLVLHLLAVLIELDMGLDPGLDNKRVEGLGDVVHGSQGQALLLMLNIGQAGDEDYGQVLGKDLLLQLFQQHEPVHLRHDHVQQDQGKIPRAGGVQSGLGRLYGSDVVVVLQNRFQLGGLYNAVVHNQYFFHVILLAQVHKYQFF